MREDWKQAGGITDSDGPRASEIRFRQIYDSYSPAIFAFALRAPYVDRKEAEDILAEVFTLLWRRLDKVPGPPETRLWLFGTTRNVMLHTARKRARQHRLQEKLRSQRPDPPVDLVPLQSTIVNTINQLSTKERLSIQLIFWEQLSHEEAAAVLGCSVNASRIRLHRAMEHLRHILRLPNEDNEVSRTIDKETSNEVRP